MAKQSSTVSAAWITGVLGLVAAIAAAVVGAVALLSEPPSPPRPSANVVTSGDSSPAFAVGGDVKDSQIVVNQPPASKDGLTEEVRTVANQVFAAMEAVPPVQPKLAAYNDLAEVFTKQLARDPYNVRAIVMRGQAYYTNAMSFGGEGLRPALADFEKAAAADKTRADPHFGIGTVLYQAGFFDLAQRGLYKIHAKGGMRLNKETGLLEMRYPSLEFFPDERNRTILQGALEEFEVGRKLAQAYTQSDGVIHVLFAPRDVEARVRSLRQFLGHEPILARDDELIKTFTMALGKLDPLTFEQLFDIEGKGAGDRKDSLN
jgi:tetratricopeptide (TPR) repeat protein